MVLGWRWHYDNRTVNAFDHLWDESTGSPVYSPHKLSVKQSFHVSFAASMNKLLKKTSRCGWLEVVWRSWGVTSVMIKHRMSDKSPLHQGVTKPGNSVSALCVSWCAHFLQVAITQSVSQLTTDRNWPLPLIASFPSGVLINSLVCSTACLLCGVIPTFDV